jgi:protein-disulfide isomerase
MRNSTLVALAIAVTACSSTSAQQAKRVQPQSDLVATVGSTPIMLADVDAKAMNQPAGNFGGVKLSQAIYEARRAALDDIIANKLMDDAAKTQGIERSALIEKEITAKIAPVSDADVQSWYAANQSRVQGRSLDEVRVPIRQYLMQDRMQTAREAYLDTLRAKTTIRLMLEPPRTTVDAANSPSKGSKSAPIELIEFSDFQCPFCLRSNPTVEQVLATYGDKIHFVYRHYPLPNHPNARPAAEAAACAAEQGKFWQYHDSLFANPAKLSTADLKQRAVDLKLDTAAFDSCVDGHKTKEKVDADQQAGEDAGVDGTPAFFINGRMISGAQPYDAFKKIIEDELKK